MRKNYFLSIFLGAAFSVSAQVTASWSALTSGTTNSLLAVSIVNSTTAYVGGDLGTILKTTDGGTTWIPQTTGVTQSIYCIQFLDANTGYAIGNVATALKTTNGGATWTPMTLPASVSSMSLRFIEFIDSNTGFIATGSSSSSPAVILKTTNGGASWATTTVTGSTSSAYSTFFTSATDGYATEYSGKILKTTNGGSNWSVVPSGVTVSMQNVFFTSVNNGLAIGASGTIRKTSDAGATWTGVAVSGISNDFLPGIDFTDASNGVIAGGDPTANTGTILTTTNGGSSWSVYNPPACPRLYRVDLYNQNLGFAVGIGGTILKYQSNVGIAENSESLTFNNYPNPFSSTTTIDLGSYQLSNNATLELYDVTGKLVKTISAQRESKILLEKGGLAAGTYIYKVLDGSNYIGSGKLVIQ